MLKTMKVYTDTQFVDRMLVELSKSRTFQIAMNIMVKLATVVIDAPMPKYMTLIATIPFYKSLQKRGNKTLIPDSDWINKTDVENIGQDIIITSKFNSAECKELRDKKGILALSIDDLELLNNMNDFFKLYYFAKKENQLEDFKENYSYSWAEVVKDKDSLFKPLNSIVINDNYIFSNLMEKGRRSPFYVLIKALIPQKVDSPIDITIVGQNKEQEINREKARKLIKAIQDEIPDKTLYINIVFHNGKFDMHKRFIVTNYFYMDADRGFAIINDSDDNVIIKNDTQGEIKSVFHNILSSNGLTVKNSQILALSGIKNIIDNITENKDYEFIEGDKKSRLLELS